MDERKRCRVARRLRLEGTLGFTVEGE